MNKILPMMLVAALGVCGCKTTENGSQLGNTIALINATVPLAVAVTVSHDPDTVGGFKAAAALIEGAAELDTVDPQELVQNVQLLGLNAEAELAVFGGIALWRAYLSQHPDALPAEGKLLLQSVARAIRAGLPPATVQQLRAKNRR